MSSSRSKTGGVEPPGSIHSSENNEEEVVAATTVDGAPTFINQIHLGIWDDPELINTIDKPTKVEAETFVAYEIKSYAAAGYIGRILWSNLQDDMISWTDDKWAVLRGQILLHFRTFLVANGVFCGHAAGTHILSNIKAAIQSNAFHVWTSEDVEYWSGKNEDFNKRVQQDREFLRGIMTASAPITIPELPRRSPTPQPRSPRLSPADLKVQPTQPTMM